MIEMIVGAFLILVTLLNPASSGACTILGELWDERLSPRLYLDGFCRPLSYDAILGVIESEAQSKARANIQITRQFVDGDRQDQGVACVPAGGPFQPMPVPIPETSSELVKKICPLVTPNERSPTHQCEFLKFNACEIEFKKMFSVVLERKQVGRTTDLRDSGVLIVRCEPVQVAGVLPKWVCGSGVAFGLDRMKVEPASDSQQLILVVSAQRAFRETYDRELDPKELAEFLRLVQTQQ